MTGVEVAFGGLIMAGFSTAVALAGVVLTARKDHEEKAKQKKLVKAQLTSQHVRAANTTWANLYAQSGTSDVRFCGNGSIHASGNAPGDWSYGFSSVTQSAQYGPANGYTGSLPSLYPAFGHPYVYNGLQHAFTSSPMPPSMMGGGGMQPRMRYAAGNEVRGAGR